MEEEIIEKTVKKRKPIRIWKVCLGIVLLILVIMLRDVRLWSKRVFGKVPFEQVVYHMNAPLEGTDSTIVTDYFSTVVLDLVLLAAILFVFFLPDFVVFLFKFVQKDSGTDRIEVQNQNECKSKNSFLCKTVSVFAKIRQQLVRLLPLFSGIILLVVLIVDLRWFGVFPWLKNQLQSSSVYEEYFVDSAEVKIIPPEQKKNLIIIVSESLEATYGGLENGGTSTEELVPNLTKLAKDNTHFSRNSNLIGALQVSGTEWTMAGLVAYTSGIPLAIPFERNTVNFREQFLPGVTTLGEILEENGYVNEMIMGSKKKFGGMDTYFEKHGNYNMVDLDFALLNAYIDEANDFWGYDDKSLFRIARERIAKAAETEQPFHFILNTIDLHSPDGFRCDLCQTKYTDSVGGELGQYMDVICCQDRQIADFIDWCKMQDFYEDTVIVVVGDHTSMAALVEEEMILSGYERTVYNVIINSDLEPSNTSNRYFTTMDMFPTILASLGFQIEGDRLGIGTNLYSGKETVTEQMGMEKYRKEIAKNSRKYNRTILKRKK